MAGFIGRKINILRQEADAVNASFLYVFIKKVFIFAFKVSADILNLIFLLISSPILVLFSLILRIRSVLRPKRNKIAFFIGLEHVINKTCERGSWLEARGYKTYYFSYQWSNAVPSPVYKPLIRKYSSSIALNTFIYLYHLIKYDPVYVEIYFEGNGFNLLIGTLLSKFNRSLTVAIERGTYCINIVEKTMPIVKKWCLDMIFKVSDSIFYREYYMLDILNKARFDKKKLYFDYNKVKINPTVDFAAREPYKVLFLNGFSNGRRIDLVVKAMKLVVQTIPEARLDIVGARHEVELKSVQNLVADEEAEAFTTIYNWTSNPQQFFHRSSVYILITEFTFCNFSLIEAMESGMPVIVMNARDTDKIVDHGINGFITDPEAENIAFAIIKLLSDPLLRKTMGEAAREKIIRSFNSEHRMDPIYELIQNRS